MKRIGVFVCSCGINIAGTLDVDQVVRDARACPGVVYAENYLYMCSDPGQDLVKRSIREKKLDGVVIAACSPTLHEMTFRRAVASAGLNPYQYEEANIREQCSWVHQGDRAEATRKATEIVRSMVEKLRGDEPLTPIQVPVTRRALVIGGGIAGMQTALDIANSGYEVVLVERLSSIGGHMIQLSETFPTLDCSQCIMTPKMVEVEGHPKISLLTYSEIEEVSGYVGNFTVRIRRKPSYVNWDACTGCAVCSEKCPTNVSSEFDHGMGSRKAIYIPFPQAVPNRPVIDAQNCRHFRTGGCGVCGKGCPADAVDFDQQETYVEERVGAIVVATGYDLYAKARVGEYGYGKYADVLDGLQFERLLSASGPTAGRVRRPSDGAVPKEVVFIQCVRSRDPERGVPYCSKVCCMYTAKHALLYRHRVPDGQAYVFYMDVRSGGKNYEEFVQRTTEEDRVLYLRGRVSRVFEEDGKIMVWGVDTLTGKLVEIAADLVVLAMAMVPNSATGDIVGKLKIATDEHGFLSEAHPKLRPVESLTAGIYLAGCAQAPKDIPETVAQAGCAANKVTALFSSPKLEHDPKVAIVDEDICVGCGICVPVCPYEARSVEEHKRLAVVNEALCQSCGACAAACPNQASQVRNLTSRQVMAMIEALE